MGVASVIVCWYPQLQLIFVVWFETLHRLCRNHESDKRFPASR